MNIPTFLVGLILIQVASCFRYMPCECGVNHFPNAISQRIVGGHEASPHSLPWMVAIMDKGNLHCGGAIISNYYILTAGHCVRWTKMRNCIVLLGIHNRKTDIANGLEIDYSILHEGFYSHDIYDDNDIALIKLKKPIIYSDKVVPVCLPRPGQSFTNKTVTVAGWGKIADMSVASDRLKEAQIVVMSEQDCKRIPDMTSFITRLMICGYGLNTDACQGDSGGPLVYEENGKTMIIGVVSWGMGCAKPGLPGIYTRVSEYIGWIDAHTRDSKFCASDC